MPPHIFMLVCGSSPGVNTPYQQGHEKQKMYYHDDLQHCTEAVGLLALSILLQPIFKVTT